MNILRAMASSVVALLLTMAPCQAGPCAKAISDAEAAWGAELGAAAASGPTARESTLATLHHQPTPNSVAHAEAQVGDISPENAALFTDAMARAHAADEAGDEKACRQALDEAGRALHK